MGEMVRHVRGAVGWVVVMYHDLASKGRSIKESHQNAYELRFSEVLSFTLAFQAPKLTTMEVEKILVKDKFSLLRFRVFFFTSMVLSESRKILRCSTTLWYLLVA